MQPGKEKRRILVAWSGKGTDPSVLDGSSLRSGPVYELLSHHAETHPFEECILLAVRETLIDAESIRAALRRERIYTPLNVREVSLRDPLDHDAIRAQLQPIIRDWQSRNQDNEYTILLNTGTPSMRVVWLGMVAQGELTAKLIQTLPARCSQQWGTPSIREVDAHIALGIPRAQSSEPLAKFSKWRFLMEGKSRALREFKQQLKAQLLLEKEVQVQAESRLEALGLLAWCAEVDGLKACRSLAGSPSVDIEVIYGHARDLDRDNQFESKMRLLVTWGAPKVELTGFHTLRLPELCARGEDLVDIARHWCRSQFGNALSREAQQLVREKVATFSDAETLLEVLSTTCEETSAPTICCAALRKSMPQDSQLSKSAKPLKARLQEVERDMIHSTLRECCGNLSATARNLGISRSSLRNRIAKLRLKTL